MTPAEQFLSELVEDYEPEEIPEIIATLQRAELATRDKPADFDLYDLSWREFMTQAGVEVPDDFKIPGVTDRIPSALNIPLRKFEKFCGPHEFRHHLLRLNDQLDRENAELGRRLAERYRVPD